MNCKPGDLAFVVNSCCGNEGVIVRCLYVVTDIKTRWPDGRLVSEPFWETVPLLRSWAGDSARPLDSQLRPIRPGDITDEEVRDLYAPKVPETA